MPYDALFEGDQQMVSIPRCGVPKPPRAALRDPGSPSGSRRADLRSTRSWAAPSS